MDHGGQCRRDVLIVFVTNKSFRIDYIESAP